MNITKEKLRATIEELSPWYQSIDFGDGIITPGGKFYGDPLWSTLRSFLPANLDQMNFLDVGSNAGIFCIRLGLEACVNVVGVERNEKWIKQSEFLMKYFTQKHDPNLPGKVKFVHDGAESFLNSIPHNTRYFAIIAISVLYHQNNPDEYARLFNQYTDTIITRWRNGDSAHERFAFNNELDRLGFYIAKEVEIHGRLFIVYERRGNWRLHKNHERLFKDGKSRSYSELMKTLTGFVNLVVWGRWDKADRKDISDFISHVSPEACFHRDFSSEVGGHDGFLKSYKKQLVQSIIKEGIHTPVVGKVIEGGFQALEGNHRVGIAKMLKHKTVPIIILEED